ncbi:hypothetical protein NKH70_13020 [Mesorhizobium sp. M0991]|uniref:nuclear transport factor 2 family protein n=1 Tax=Mesorhizobium sp. M0991 TaxID=2957043 RepID=UPI0033354749
MTDLDSERTRNLETVRKFFDLMHRKDIEAWGDLWAEDGRILVFYPPAGFGNSIDGKAAILAAFRILRFAADSHLSGSGFGRDRR